MSDPELCFACNEPIVPAERLIRIDLTVLVPPETEDEAETETVAVCSPSCIHPAITTLSESWRTATEWAQTEFDRELAAAAKGVS